MSTPTRAPVGVAADLATENARLRAALGTQADRIEALITEQQWFEQRHVQQADHILAQAKRIADLVAENERLREALTPSGDTKAEYSGEFKITVPDTMEDEDGETVECQREVLVPWTTIKEVMAAIRARAALPHPQPQ